MKKTLLLLFIVSVFISGISFADIFAEGTANEFTIDFVPISGDAGDLGSWSAGSNYTFSGVNSGDYRMGTYEITNDQWAKFKSAYGDVKGTPTSAYDSEPFFTGTNVPTNRVSWYEAVQFVNWLNIDAGHQAAYNFTGTQGTDDYTLGVWETEDAWGGTNLFRHKDAFYFLPTEDEWVKAAYWNGSALQPSATKADESLYQGNGSNGGWNYYNNRYATDPYGPWAVGSGSEELNGTYDMMGNVWEWMESPFMSGDYLSDSVRGVRGGSFSNGANMLGSSLRDFRYNPSSEELNIGFRVASVPEPCSLVLLGLGGLALCYRKR